MTQTKQAIVPVAEKSISERFVAKVMQEFKSLFGNGLQITQEQKQLAQHLFIKIDQSLQSYETKRIASGQNSKMPFVWENINIPKLATDAMHRINLGLDALIQNHISPIPYFNSREKKYDLDLRIGYVGKDYYRRKMAIDPPDNVVYELVYSTDDFIPIKKDIDHEIETYKFTIKNAWNRGEVIGGFGYIVYSDPKKNKLILVSEEDFQKAENSAPSKEFWKINPIPMKYKTIVHRTTEKIPPDPKKINESYIIVEQDDMEGKILAQIEGNANKEFIDIEKEPKQGINEQPQEEQKKELKQQSFSQPERGPGF